LHRQFEASLRCLLRFLEKRAEKYHLCTSFAEKHPSYPTVVQAAPHLPRPNASVGPVFAIGFEVAEKLDKMLCSDDKDGVFLRLAIVTEGAPAKVQAWIVVAAPELLYETKVLYLFQVRLRYCTICQADCAGIDPSVPT
jgi:hypothetical protein